MTWHRQFEARWPINTSQTLRVVWLVFTLFALNFALRGIPYYLDLLHTPCNGSACFPAQLPIEMAAAWLASGSTLDIYALVQLLTLLTIGGLLLTTAALLIWRKWNQRLSLLVAFTGTAMATGTLSQALAHAEPRFYLPAQAIHFVQIAGLLPLLCLFPDGRFQPHWMRWVAVLYVLVSLIYVIQPKYMADSPANAYRIMWVVLGLFFLFVGSASLVYRYRHANTAKQQEQTLWVLAGFCLATVAVLIGTPLRLLNLLPLPMATFVFDPLLLALTGMLLVIGSGTCLLVALINYEPINSEVLINRALGYSILTACVVALYVTIVGGLGLIFQSQGNLLFSLLATGMIAVLFQPLRERLQRAINRLMYGERDEPYRLITRLGQQLEAALEPLAALPLIVETVAHALKLPYVAIKLNQTDMSHTVAAYGSRQNEITVFPLVYSGQTIGELSVAQRAAEQPLSPADNQLLHDLARQISVTAHAMLLSADLEQARQRIVAAREEARRRLGNDLHDGVGHQLTGLSRQVEAAVSLLDQNPTAANQMLTAVTQQLNAAISQVRYLAHQLHPPELGLLGLAGALRERALTQSGLLIHLDAPEPLPPLPPAVETAAYYIALEALTNVEKHTDARACRLRLAMVDGELEMEVSDDGPGLTANHANGLGLLSMQARANEVGGSCRIDSDPAGGVRVIVRLPCSD